MKPLAGKRVTAVDMQGVSAANAVKLKTYLVTKVGQKIDQDSIKLDLMKLSGLGVFSEINPVFQVVPEGVKITYVLVANPVVKNVQVDGNTVYPQAKVLNYLSVPKNQVLNSVELGRKLKGLESAYQRDGYMLAKVTGVNVDPQGVLHVNINEGIVEDIVVSGNKKTKSYVVTREMIQKKGQPLNKYLARRSLQRVYNLGYFSDVNMRLLPGKDPNKVVMEIDVIEQKTGIITVGAGYSKSNGFSGLLEVGEQNFRGTGDKIKLHYEFGGNSAGKNYSLSYTRPWLDSKGTSLGATLYNRRDQYTDYQSDGKAFSTYLRRSQGLSVSLGRPKGIFTREYLTLETRKDSWIAPDKDNAGNYSGAVYSSPGFKKAFPGPEGANYINNNFGRTNSVTYQIVYDSRDNIYDAHHGKRLSASVQYAGLGGNFNFWKVSAEGRMYHELGNHHVIAMRATAGMIKGDAAYSQLFAVGGSNSLRGYEDDQFRGEKFYNASIEYRMPLFKKVSGVVFVDVGSAWDTPHVPWYKGGKKFNVGYGPGLRIQTPIGPVRLDYGFGRNGGKFTFAFGGQF